MVKHGPRLLFGRRRTDVVQTLSSRVEFRCSNHLFRFFILSTAHAIARTHRSTSGNHIISGDSKSCRLPQFNTSCFSLFATSSNGQRHTRYYYPSDGRTQVAGARACRTSLAFLGNGCVKDKAVEREKGACVFIDVVPPRLIRVFMARRWHLPLATNYHWQHPSRPFLPPPIAQLNLSSRLTRAFKHGRRTK
jgi:hypothetical protein